METLDHDCSNIMGHCGLESNCSVIVTTADMITMAQSAGLLQLGVEYSSNNAGDGPWSVLHTTGEDALQQLLDQQGSDTSVVYVRGVRCSACGNVADVPRSHAAFEGTQYCCEQCGQSYEHRAEAVRNCKFTFDLQTTEDEAQRVLAAAERVRMERDDGKAALDDARQVAEATQLDDTITDDNGQKGVALRKAIAEYDTKLLDRQVRANEWATLMARRSQASVDSMRLSAAQNVRSQPQGTGTAAVNSPEQQQSIARRLHYHTPDALKTVERPITGFASGLKRKLEMCNRMDSVLHWDTEVSSQQDVFGDRQVIVVMDTKMSNNFTKSGQPKLDKLKQLGLPDFTDMDQAMAECDALLDFMQSYDYFALACAVLTQTVCVFSTVKLAAHQSQTAAHELLKFQAEQGPSPRQLFGDLASRLHHELDQQADWDTLIAVDIERFNERDTLMYNTLHSALSDAARTRIGYDSTRRRCFLRLLHQVMSASVNQTIMMKNKLYVAAKVKTEANPGPKDSVSGHIANLYKYELAYYRAYAALPDSTEEQAVARRLLTFRKKEFYQDLRQKVQVTEDVTMEQLTDMALKLESKVGLYRKREVEPVINAVDDKAIKCYSCGKFGHRMKDCKAKNKADSKEKKTCHYGAKCRKSDCKFAHPPDLKKRKKELVQELALKVAAFRKGPAPAADQTVAAATEEPSTQRSAAEQSATDASSVDASNDEFVAYIKEQAAKLVEGTRDMERERQKFSKGAAKGAVKGSGGKGGKSAGGRGKGGVGKGKGRGRGKGSESVCTFVVPDDVLDRSEELDDIIAEISSFLDDLGHDREWDDELWAHFSGLVQRVVTLVDSGASVALVVDASRVCGEIDTTDRPTIRTVSGKRIPILGRAWCQYVARTGFGDVALYRQRAYVCAPGSGVTRNVISTGQNRLAGGSFLDGSGPKGATLYSWRGEERYIPPNSSAVLQTPMGQIIQLEHPGSGALSILPCVVNESELTPAELTQLTRMQEAFSVWTKEIDEQEGRSHVLGVTHKEWARKAAQLFRQHKCEDDSDDDGMVGEIQHQPATRSSLDLGALSTDEALVEAQHVAMQRVRSGFDDIRTLLSVQHGDDDHVQAVIDEFACCIEAAQDIVGRQCEYVQGVDGECDDRFYDAVDGLDDGGNAGASVAELTELVVSAIDARDDTASIKLGARDDIGSDQNSDIGPRPGPETPARSRGAISRYLSSSVLQVLFLGLVPMLLPMYLAANSSAHMYVVTNENTLTVFKHVHPSDYWRVHVKCTEQLSWTAESVRLCLQDMYTNIGEIDHLHYTPPKYDKLQHSKLCKQLVDLRGDRQQMLVTVTVPAKSQDAILGELSDMQVRCANLVLAPTDLGSYSDQSLVLEDTLNTEAYIEWFADVRTAHEDFIFDLYDGVHSAAHIDWLDPEVVLNFGVVNTSAEAEQFFEDGTVTAEGPVPVQCEHVLPKRRLKREMAPALAKLLHARFGHCSRRVLRSAMVRLKMLDKCRLPADIPCEACDRAKAKRRPHSGQLKPTEFPFEVVHADLIVVNKPDIDGNLYSLQLRDDKSGETWSYAMKSKADVGLKLREWLALIRARPSEIRFDAGGEFKGLAAGQVLQLCYEYSIRPFFTLSHQHEANGVIERSHQTLFRMAMAMLLYAKLPVDDPVVYWSYALRTATHCSSFLPQKGKLLSPHEILYGHAGKFRVRAFGARLVYRQEDSDRQAKWQDRGHRGIYLGPTENYDGCYVLDLDNSKSNGGDVIRVTRDVLDRSWKEVLDDIPATEQREIVQFWDDHVCRHEHEPDDNEFVPDPIPTVLLEQRRREMEFIMAMRARLHSEGTLTPAQIENRIAYEVQRLQMTEATRRLRAVRSTPGLETVSEETVRGEDSTGVLGKRSVRFGDSVGRPGVGPSRIVHARQPSDGDQNFQMAGSDGTRLRSARTVSKPMDPAPAESMAKLLSEANRRVLPTVVSQSHLNEDTECCLCSRSDHVNSNASDMQVWVCDGCDKAYHKRCLGVTWRSRLSWSWFCPDCCQIGMEVMVKPRKRWQKATVTALGVQGNATMMDVDTGSKFDVNMLNKPWYPVTEEISLVTVHGDDFTKEPKSWAAIQRLPEGQVKAAWIQAANDEMEALKKRGVFSKIRRCDLPAGTRVIPTIWVFRYKQPPPGETVGRCKARCCLLGNKIERAPYQPGSGMVHNSTVNPRMATVRLLLAKAAQNRWKVHSTDASNAFAQARATNLTYAQAPPGFNEPGFVYLVAINLYGDVAAPAAWSSLFKNFMISQGFTVNPLEPAVFVKRVANAAGVEKPLIVAAWVDDAIVMHESEKVVMDFKREMRKAFTGTETDSVTQFLGIQLNREPGDGAFSLSQERLINKIVDKCTALPQTERKWYLPVDPKNDSHVPILKDRLKTQPQPVTEVMHAQLAAFPYREVLGAIGYVMTSTRPDIAYAWKELSRFSSCYRDEHIEALLVLVSYLRRTKRKALVLTGTSGSATGIRAYADADWNGSDQHRSTTGWICFYENSPISWASRTQKASAKSTCEAELIAISSCASELLFLRRLNDTLDNSASWQPSVIEMYGNKLDGETDMRAVHLFSDSASAIQAGNKPTSFVDGRMRHVKTSFYFFRNHVAAGSLRLMKVAGTDNPADIMSKGFCALKRRFDRSDVSRAKSVTAQSADYFQKLANKCLGRDLLPR